MSQNPQPPDKQLTHMFINYRRADTSGHAGRLEGELSKRFPGRVFMDIHTIEVGKDFAEAINDEVGKCGALIVIIGNQWLDITDPKTGKRRLDNPDDFVALEIAGALKRDTRVIPVLVEGATMPQESDLPPALAGLVRRNAIEISDTRWDYDVERLVKVLEKICGITPQQQPAPTTTMPTEAGRAVASSATPAKSGVLKIVLISVVATFIAMVALVMYLGSSGEDSTAQPQANIAKIADQPQANVAAPANAAKPPEAAKPPVANTDPRMQAIVDRSKGEAEFVFPFDTTGNAWEWFLKKSKADVDEYHWDILVVDVPNDTDYKITLYVQKETGDALKKGNFKSLLGNTYRGVQLRKGDADWGGIDDKFPVKISHAVEPDKLRILVKGEGVKRIFASNPEDVTFMIVTPKQPAQIELTESVEYK